MTNKTKKITLLTAGIAGTLLASSVAAVTLSACTIQAALPPNYVDPNKPAPTPSVQYNTEINWDVQTNEDWELGMPLPVNRLEQDENGFIYADKAHTQLIAMLPSIKVSEITIPAQVQQISGYVKVVKNGTNTTKRNLAAFQDNTNLTTVKFAPGSKLRAINSNAFNGCSNLQTIQLPSSVKTVHNGAFQNTSNLTSINLENINYIGIDAFKNSFTSDASINLELKLNNVLRIGDNAFENVSNIKAIDLSKNSKLLSIGASAFKGAKLAETFDLSNSKALATIGNSAFENTTNVQTIKLPDTFGFSSTPLGTAVFKNSSITSIDLSKTQIKDIPANTFESAANLADVKLNDEITTFGDASFIKTVSLKTLALPSKLSNISAAFKEDFNDPNASNKSGIAELDFSKTQVTQFPNNAFEGAQNLVKVILNDKLTTIGEVAFRNASSLTTIGPNGTSDGTLKLPASFTSFGGSYNFQGTQITNVDLSETNITSISHEVFGGNSTINTIRYPNTLTNLLGGVNSLPSLISIDLSNTKITSIQQDAFKGAKKLESIILPDSVITIGQSAFEDTKISAIELPEKVNSIGNYAFKNTKSLKSITIKTSNPAYKTIKANNGAIFSSYLNSIGTGAFLGSALELIDLSNTRIREIPSYAFGECEELTTIYVPNTIGALASRIFASNDAKFQEGSGVISNAKLTTFGTKKDLGVDTDSTKEPTKKIIIPRSVNNLTNNTFEYSGIVDIDLSNISGFRLGNTIDDGTRYGLTGMDWMFNGATQLETVVLPYWVKGKIAANAFNNTKSLKSVTVAGFPTTNTYADDNVQIQPGTFDISQSNISGFAGTSQFKNSNLGTFKFPEKFDRTTIPASAFEGTKLTEVNVQTSTTKAIADNNILGENTTTINNNAFSNIPTLTKIKLPSSLTTINNNAFRNIAPDATMTFENGINLPTATTDTATNAFANSLVNEVNLSGSTGLTTISPGTFNGASGLNKITLPAKAVKWKTAESGSGASKTYSNNPLFNNDNALNIEFTMFTKNDDTALNDFNDIEDKTKQQIANIMNMFSNYAGIATAHPVQYSNWATRVDQSPINSWIDTDLTKDNVFSDWTKDGNNTNIDNTTTTGATIAHNGVTWVYEKDTTSGNITIKTQTTSPTSTINMYRTISDTDWDSADTNGGKFQANQGRQTYFSAPLNNTNGAPNSNVRVTVTMKIVVKSN